MTEQWSQTCTLNNNPTWLWKINYALTFISSSIWLDSDISYILVLESFWKAMFVDSGQSTRMRLGSCKEGCRGSREEIREGVSLYSHIGTWPYGLMFMGHIKKKIHLNGQFPQKWKFRHRLLVLMSSQSCVFFFLLWNIHEDIFASLHPIKKKSIWFGYKYSSMFFCVSQKNKVMQLWNDIKLIIKWWRYFHFWVSYIFITLHFLYCVLSWLEIVIFACIIVLYCPL